MQHEGKTVTLEDIFLDKKFEPEIFVPFQTALPISVGGAVNHFLGHAIEPGSYHWNAGKTYILFKNNVEPIHRRSTKENVFVLDVKTNVIQPVNEEKTSHATFSPDGKMVAYVWANNLFVYFLEESKTVQITEDGKWNEVANGNCNWVYEEEFGFSQAYRWSPDSTMLAFYRLDESRVETYSFPLYDDRYNQPYTYKYPKAGEENSEVEIYCYHIAEERKVRFTVKTDGGYIPKILWSAENELHIFHLNRRQNQLNIWKNDPVSARSEIIYTENNERYIDLTDDWYFLPDDQLVYTTEQSGFRNIYLQKADRTSVALTQNSFDLSHIVSIDKTNHWIYFVAAFPNPMERHLFVVDFDGNQKQLSTKDGWNHIHINEEKTKIIVENCNIREPATADQYDIILDETEKQPVLQHEKTLLDNAKLKERLSEYKLAQPAFMQIHTGEDCHVNGWMLLPADFDGQKEHPLLFCNYGGPGSQTVLNKYGAVSMWHHLLSQNGFILVSVDNTGTGFRGEDFKKKTYLQLGKLEMEDQTKVAKHLASLPYVDANRIGHWGWSFGGFMSCLAITKGAGIFSYAVAVAPVTSWKYYDTIYTERYMQTPQENAEGYADNSPFAYSDNMKGALLLIHGSADDNVHLQHSLQWSKQLVEKNIPFDMAIYPDKDHRITGGNTSIHLYRKATQWLLAHS